MQCSEESVENIAIVLKPDIFEYRDILKSSIFFDSTIRYIESSLVLYTQLAICIENGNYVHSQPHGRWNRGSRGSSCSPNYWHGRAGHSSCSAKIKQLQAKSKGDKLLT